MADFNFTIKADDKASQQIDYLRTRIQALSDAIQNLNRSNMGGSASFAKALIDQLDQAQRELQKLQGTFLQTFSAADQFSTRAIAAMRGIPEAVAPATRALDETDKIMRAGAHGGQLLNQSLKNAIESATGLGRAITPTKERARELAEAFGAQVEHAGFATSAIASLGQAHVQYGEIVRHTTAIIDGALRGQRGQMEASFIALVRDSGVLGGAISALSGPWGLFAAAGVAALAAVAYEFEQSFQRFASIRESASALAMGGGLGSGQARDEATGRFDTLKSETNAYAGTIRDLQKEIDKLPPSMQSSWHELANMAIASAAFKNEDPAKVMGELAKAAQASPQALGEATVKMFGLQGQLLSTGEVIEEAIKHASSLTDVLRILGDTNVPKKMTEAGQALGVAKNSLLEVMWATAGASDGLFVNMANTEELTKTYQKIIDPLNGVDTATRQVSESILAQSRAMAEGNAGLDKRIALLSRMAAAEDAVSRLSADPKSTDLQRERARSAAGTLEAEVRLTPQDPAEERRHRMIMENIHAEAQARHADVEAQVEAARQVLAETQRSETQRLIGAGMDPETAARWASESEAVQKAKDAVTEAEAKSQDAQTALAIAGVQDRIAAESHGSKEKIALQQEIINIEQRAVTAGRQTQIQLENAKRAQVAYAREANREEYSEAAKNYENQLREAKGNYDAIITIIAEWRANAAQHFKQGSVDFIRAMEDATRAAILAFRTVVEEAESSASSLQAANRDILQTFEHSQSAKLRDMGAAGIGAAPAAIKAEMAEARRLSEENVKALQEAMKLADKGLVGEEQRTAQTRIYWGLWREGINLKREDAQFSDRMAEAQKRITEEAKNTQIAQLKLSEAIAKARGDLEEVVKLRIQEAQIVQGDKYATPAQKINAQTDIVNAMAEEQNRAFSALGQLESSRERFDKIRIAQNKAQLQAQVADHTISKETMEAKESEFTGKVLAEEERRIESMIANNQLTSDQKEKLYAQLSELYEKDAENQVQAQEKITAAIEKENEKRTKLFKDTFDKIGDGAEKALEGLFTGERDQNMLQNLRKSLVSSVVGGAFSLGSQFLGKHLAPVLGVKTEGLADTSLGGVLGRAISNLLGLTKQTPEDAMKGVADKLQKAADAQNKAIELLKPAAEHLKEISEKLTQLLGQVKSGGSPVGDTGSVGGKPGSGSTAIDTEELKKLDAIRAEAERSLPAGYKAVVSSSERPGAVVADTGAPSEHGKGHAMDVKILDPSGNVVQGYMGGGGEVYRQFDQAMIKARDKLYPGEAMAVGSTFRRRPDAGHYSMGGEEAARNEANRSGTQSTNQLSQAATKAATALNSIKPPSGSGANGAVAPPPPMHDASGTIAPTEGLRRFYDGGWKTYRGGSWYPDPAEPATPGYASGGPVGSDTVPAWLTPGERVLSRSQRALYDRMFPNGIEHHQSGGIAGSQPGLTSLTTESRGFAPFHLIQTNPGLGKGWGLLLGLLGAVGLAAGAAWLFGDKDKDKKDKELAQKLLAAKDSGTIGDSTQTTTQLSEDQLPKMHSGGVVPSTGAYFLEGGEVVTPRDSPTYSPAAGGGSGQTSQVLAKLGEEATTTTQEMSALAGDVSKVTQALSGLARTAGSGSPLQNATQGLSSIFSSVGSAVSGVTSLFKMFGGSGGGDSGGIGGIFSSVGSIFKGITSIIPFLEGGGIIPSAQGGMIVGGIGRGGTLSILHPNEMVLPSHISQSVQDMAQGGGPGGTAPDIHFHLHTIDQRSGAQFLMSHRDTIAGLYRQSYRNFSPNLPY